MKIIITIYSGNKLRMQFYFSTPVLFRREYFNHVNFFPRRGTLLSAVVIRAAHFAYTVFICQKEILKAFLKRKSSSFHDTHFGKHYYNIVRRTIITYCQPLRLPFELIVHVDQVETHVVSTVLRDWVVDMRKCSASVYVDGENISKIDGSPRYIICWLRVRDGNRIRPLYFIDVDTRCPIAVVSIRVFCTIVQVQEITYYGCFDGFSLLNSHYETVRGKSRVEMSVTRAYRAQIMVVSKNRYE